MNDEERARCLELQATAGVAYTIALAVALQSPEREKICRVIRDASNATFDALLSRWTGLDAEREQFQHYYDSLILDALAILEQK